MSKPPNAEHQLTASHHDAGERFKTKARPLVLLTSFVSLPTTRITTSELSTSTIAPQVTILQQDKVKSILTIKSQALWSVTRLPPHSSPLCHQNTIKTTPQPDKMGCCCSKTKSNDMETRNARLANHNSSNDTETWNARFTNYNYLNDTEIRNAKLAKHNSPRPFSGSSASWGASTLSDGASRRGHSGHHQYQERKIKNMGTPRTPKSSWATKQPTSSQVSGAYPIPSDQLQSSCYPTNYWTPHHEAPAEIKSVLHYLDRAGANQPQHERPQVAISTTPQITTTPSQRTLSRLIASNDE